MRRILIFALPALTVACSSGGDSEDDALEAVLDGYAAAVDAVHDTVDAHVEAVSDESDYDAIGAHEDSYMEDMEHAMEDFEHAMDDVDGCSMGSESMGMAGDARTMMDGLFADAQAHADAHEDHADADACHEAEETHEVDMDTMLDELVAHHDHWHDDGDMMCEMHDDDMGAGHED